MGSWGSKQSRANHPTGGPPSSSQPRHQQGSTQADRQSVIQTDTQHTAAQYTELRVPPIPEQRTSAMATASVDSESARRSSFEGTQPRSRANSFSLLHRSKSREDGLARKPSKKLKRKSKPSKEGATHEPAPSLPTTANFSNLNIGYPVAVDGSNPLYNTNFSHPGPPASSASSSAAYARPLGSGYNPNSFYQKARMESDPPGSGSFVKPPIPPVPESDPFARTESMTNRGRYSYTSSASNRVRRRKDPTPFNVLVIGTKNCGKTSFIEFLRHALASKKPIRTTNASISTQAFPREESHPFFSSQYLETEFDGERIGLTLYDSKGLEAPVIDIHLREVSSFVESKFNETFYEEQKVLRATGVHDPHIHCVILLLDPARLDQNLAAVKRDDSEPNLTTQQRLVGPLDGALDVDLLNLLQGKTTVIPVISKADTVTTARMSLLKRSVWDAFRKIKFDPIAALNIESDDESTYSDDKPRNSHDAPPNAHEDADSDDERFVPTKEYSSQSRSMDHTDHRFDSFGPSSHKAPQHADIRFSTMSTNVDLPYLPLSIISPDDYEPGTVGRRFPWGFADPYNTDHCDFPRLKENIFSDWREDLVEAAREQWYEAWRTTRLKRRPQLSTNPSMARNMSSSQVSGTNAGRSVSGRGPEYSENPQSVHASDIGVAVSNGVDTRSLPRSWRGVGTY